MAAGLGPGTHGDKAGDAVVPGFRESLCHCPRLAAGDACGEGPVVRLEDTTENLNKLFSALACPVDDLGDALAQFSMGIEGGVPKFAEGELLQVVEGFCSRDLPGCDPCQKFLVARERAWHVRGPAPTRPGAVFQPVVDDLEEGAGRPCQGGPLDAAFGELRGLSPRWAEVASLLVRGIALALRLLGER